MKGNTSNKTKGILSLFLAALMLGTFGIWVRILNLDMTVYQQIFFRNSIALVISIAVLLIIRKMISLKNVNKKFLFIYAIAFPLSVVFFTISILLTKIAVTLFALYVGSIVTSFVIGACFFKERINFIKIVSVATVFAGLAFLTFPILDNSMNLGILFGLLSGVSESVGNAFRKHLGGKIDRFFLVAVAMVGGIIMSAALVLLNHQSILFFAHISMVSWIVGFTFGILLFAVSYLTIIGFHYAELGSGTLVYSSEILFGIIFGIIFFGEYLQTKEIIGGVLILVAIALPHIKLGNKG